ncbi:MAG: hypothetical protein HC939_23480 [Pleurocapsa sp. SU_5_0]|nr:hypothetical protein [Pleurocapsa sp. SU_5_0]
MNKIFLYLILSISVILLNTHEVKAYDYNDDNFSRDSITDNLERQEEMNREVYELENMQYNSNSNNGGGGSIAPRLVIFALSGIFGAIAYGNKK